MVEHLRFRTGDQSLVREINLSLILRQLREYAPISRAALAEMTGLNKSTVSSLIDELIRRQFVREVGLSSTRIGRPSRLLELNPQAGYIISAEIGVDFISIMCANFAAETIWQHREMLSAAEGQETILKRFLAFLLRGQETGSGIGSLLGAAVGVPGLVDQRDGTLLFAPNLGWQNVPLGDLLRTTFRGVPVFVDNEANMSALGERLFGAAQGYDEVLYISAGVGLGGAILRDGQVFRGKAGFASEFGHMTMNPRGARCACGNRGCWETQVNQAAVIRNVQQALNAGKYSLLLELAHGDFSRLTLPMIVDAAHAGDRVSRNALVKVGHHLGVGIASLVNALNPEMVVFGGTLSLAWDYLSVPIQLEVQRRALRWNAAATQIVLAQHGVNACVMGGVAMVYNAILSQPGNLARSTA